MLFSILMKYIKDRKNNEEDIILQKKEERLGKAPVGKINGIPSNSRCYRTANQCTI